MISLNRSLLPSIILSRLSTNPSPWIFPEQPVILRSLRLVPLGSPIIVAIIGNLAICSQLSHRIALLTSRPPVSVSPGRLSILKKKGKQLRHFDFAIASPASRLSYNMGLRRAARVILVGAPGVGKGTQSERLLHRFPQLQCISSGDLLRANVKDRTALGETSLRPTVVHIRPPLSHGR